MKPSVYVETSVIGYLAMRPSALLVTAANQQVTREFWDDHRSRFELFTSLAGYKPPVICTPPELIEVPEQ